MAKRIFSLAAVCLLGFMLLPAANESAQTVSVAVGSNSPAADGASAAGQLLFPELSDTDITGIRIHANDDCEFDFSVRGELSVNGQKADEEVFSTLVDQLTADSFTLCDDFEPQNDALLTVTVYTDTQDFSASFYQEQGDALADTVFKHVYPLIGYAALLEKALGFLGVKAFSAINLITHLDSSVLFLIIEHDNRFTPFRQAVVFFGPKPFLQKQAEARMAHPIFAL